MVGQGQFAGCFSDHRPALCISVGARCPCLGFNVSSQHAERLLSLSLPAAQLGATSMSKLQL